ncbi:MAG: hypothetical protein ACI8QC_000646 [Planctomycetota bacterium]|jgi:hypothetical protein
MHRLGPMTCVLLLTASSCSQTSDSSPPTTQAGLSVLSVNLTPTQPWPLNRPIEISFNQDIDPLSLSTTAVQVVGLGSSTGVPLGSSAQAGADNEVAYGSLELVSPAVVRFTPTCPTGSNGQGAGLRAGLHYRLRLPGGGSAQGITSLSGSSLGTTFTASFSTPFSGDPAERFDDPVAGPPAIVVRAAASNEELASYLEIGGDPLARVYFEVDAGGSTVLPGNFLAPLNTYSDSATQVAYLLRFDQPIDPSQANLERMRLEFDDSGTWHPFGAVASMASGCGLDGVFVRLEPQGILPQGTRLRLLLEDGLSDLSGESTGTSSTDLETPTASAYDPGTQIAGASADRLLESFLSPALEDTELGSGAPRADWGTGQLTAKALDFAGSGGPEGTFDWIIPAGETYVFSTLSQTITGGPNGAPTHTQTVINGVVDVDDFWIQGGAVVVVIGPNPFTLLATGSVRIDGELRAGGGNSAGVVGLNTTNQPELGAHGNAGGGRGGTASFLTTMSTPTGGTGFGAFDVPDGGGFGGEASYSAQGINARRGAGGGGGKFASDTLYRWAGQLVECQTLVGMDAEPGFSGGAQGLGAVSQSMRAQGGAIGSGPFLDGNPSNDFRGSLRLMDGTLIQGELQGPLAGSGGGGGGDAVKSNSFPLIPFSNSGDEKGAGAGGGGGSIRIVALGQIRVAANGYISANGGHGGGGENTLFFNRVGGGSGGGSGGSIYLESLDSIQLLGGAPGSDTFYTDDPNASTHSRRSLSALGGQGGAGHDNKGGARETGVTAWRCDAIPINRVQPLAVPPFGNVCFNNQPDFADSDGPTLGAGGDGGPGLIQLVVPNPSVDLSYPAAMDITQVSVPPPVGWADGAFFGELLPSLRLDSIAQSRWIDLGEAAHDPMGNHAPAEFFLQGLDANGVVTTTGGIQDYGMALVPAATVVADPGLPFIGPNPFSMTFDAAGVTGSADVYERNPLLLLKAIVRMTDPVSSDSMDFVVAAAEYDPSLDLLTVTVSSGSGTLTSFATAGVTAELIPRHLGLIAADSSASLPSGSSVRVRLDATMAGPDGEPDPSQAYSAVNGGLPSDPTSLNSTIWDFVRFRVDFELSPTEPIGPRPSLDFLSIPFRF